MLDKLQLVEERYLEMSERASQPDFYNDPKAATKLLKEQRQLEPIVETFRRYKKTRQELADLRDMLDGQLDPEMRELCQEEFTQGKKDLEELEQQLTILLLPRDPNDEKDVIMEIRGGVGGEESALFAHSLFRMYSMYADKHGFKVQLLNYNETELGGVKEADFIISGDGAYSRLKFESGNRGRRPCPHLHRHCGSFAGNRYRRRGNPTRRHRNAGFPFFRRRWSAHQQDLLRSASDPQAIRSRGGLSGRTQPAPEPGAVYADACLQAL